jgi:glutaredoxin 3
MSNIIIYMKPTCPYCVKAMGLLNSKNAKFEKIDIAGNDNLRTQMIEKSGGRTTVPQIFIHGKHIGGCDDLHALEAKGELNKLLK